jgi:hypothetical protein
MWEHRGPRLTQGKNRMTKLKKGWYLAQVAQCLPNKKGPEGRERERERSIERNFRFEFLFWLYDFSQVH